MGPAPALKSTLICSSVVVGPLILLLMLLLLLVCVVGGSVVLWLGHRTRDRQVVGSIPGHSIAGQRPWASCSHQCASATKQYKLVPCEVLLVNAPHVTAMAWVQ